MTTTEKKPRAKKLTAAETVAKLKQTSLALPQPDAPELAFVPLDLIDTAEQVRTEFDDETLAELASDIAARGVLQPVLLRKKDDGRFLMIAGERRLRAARLASLTAIPAIVGVIEQDDADDMQLAENIQREDLSLADTAAAIRRLFDRLGSLQAVADKVHKSKSWVSKRLTITCPGFNWRVTQLLEAGTCEDIETLNSLAKVYDEDWTSGDKLRELIMVGKAGRETARQWIKTAKENREESRRLADEQSKARSEEQAINYKNYREAQERNVNEQYELHKVKLRAIYQEFEANEKDFLYGLENIFSRYMANDLDLESSLADLMEAVKLAHVGALFEEKK